MTNDVECFSFEHNQYEPAVAQRVLKQGLPRLLDLYDKYDVNATFFYTGKIVEVEPEVIDIVKERGRHEIGCHGYSHELDCGFDCMPPNQQKEHLIKAKKLIEKITNNKIISFRAPALRINENTLPTAEKLGFQIDSSVSSQRFDIGLSFGSKNKMKWLFAPRRIYHPSKNDPFKPGNLKILEIPISAFILPYISTTLRSLTKTTKILEKIIFRETKKNLVHPACFVIHPNEVMDLDCDEPEICYRSEDYINQLFKEKLRLKLKYRNLGKAGLKILGERLKYAKHEGFKFNTLKEYYEVIRNEGSNNNPE